MNGLMMDYQLTLPTILRRVEAYFGAKEVVTRLPDKSFHRYTYADMARRSKQLAVALKGLGLDTLNIRLHPNDIGYIALNAGDRALIVDASLMPLVDQFLGRTRIEHVFVVEDSYEDLLATADPDDWSDPLLEENEAAAMCYTSGTTGL